jgi:hypothetical protein
MDAAVADMAPVADLVADESWDEIDARKASVPALKASPVLPSSNVELQQFLPLIGPQQKSVGKTPAVHG